VRKLVTEFPHYNVVNLDKLDYCATTNNNTDIERFKNYTFIKVCWLLLT
jgi:dTDP-D-glucose 4,6-dehydratase